MLDSCSEKEMKSVRIDEQKKKKVNYKIQWKESTKFGHLSTPFTQNDEKILSKV